MILWFYSQIMIVNTVLIVIILLYIFWDVNYFIRTYFCVWSGRIFGKKSLLKDISVIFGMGTFQDCDIRFQNVRLARLIRELDFARYHFYDRTGVYSRSKELQIKSLQGSTFVVSSHNLPIFTPYLIKTELVFWDEKSLFFEHKVVTIHDKLVRVFLVSRQYAMGGSTKELLNGLPGSEDVPLCPDYVQLWLQSNVISSNKIRTQ